MEGMADVMGGAMSTDEMIKLSGGKRSVPQIFYGDIHIGGSDDLYNMNIEGKLDQLIGLEIK